MTQTRKPRTRREMTKAVDLKPGDVIAPAYHGAAKATVTRVDPYHRNDQAVSVQYAYPNDFTVNASFRGQHGGSVVAKDHEYTRYVR
jgi:hypothetical protein